ncbi:putative ribonuclease H-like domain-containing protein [Tanacetum coccineum]
MVVCTKTSQENGTLVTKMSVPVTVEEKTNKKNDVKDRSLLLMALPNGQQLIFYQYPDAKTMFATIETRFGGNEATKKTQKILLKQQYENFSASSTESLDFIFNRLQKIVNRLAILGVVISQEDLNSKILSSLPPEWNTHVVVWMNKPKIETMSIDDSYNNFKIVEQKVKKSIGASSGAQNLAFMTAPSTSSTNHVNTAMPAYEVSIACPDVNTANLEQIHEDDLEAMDLKWQLSLLIMRAKRECRAPKNKEGQFRNQDNTRKQGNNKDTSSKEILAIDGVGFEWSDMAEEQVQKNMALMAFSDFEVYNDQTCSKTYLKNYETLKKQCDDLIVKLNQTEFIAATYKRDLATVEEQLITYRKNEVLFSEEVVVLKREVACKDYEINVLKSKFEKVKQEKEGIEFKIEKFDKASKDLDKLLESQITDKSKKGLGYSVVPPPYPLIYNRPKKLDLSYSGLDEFKEPEFKGYGSKDSKKESNVVCDKKSDDSKENSDNSLIKEQVSKDTSSFVESSLNVDKETVFPVDKKIEFVKPKNHEKPVKKSVRLSENTIKGKGWTVNTAHPKSTVFSAKPMSCFLKTAQSTVRRPFESKTTLSNKRFTHKVNIAKVQAVNTTRPQAVNIARPKTVKTARPNSAAVNAVRVNQANGKPQQNDTGFVDSGCSRHMTGNIAYLSDFKEFDGGYVTFGGGAHGGRISGKGTLKTDSLDFEDVYFVNELKFNLFSVSQFPDESQILLKIPRKDNMYSFDMKNIVPKETLTCLVTKDRSNESMLWHRRLGHINFKSINKLVKDNLVRGLPTKPVLLVLKGSNTELHVSPRFTWVFFLTTKDETSEILKNFIKEIENLVDKEVKIIRSDNGTEFKNKVMDDFCKEKSIKREYSVARTPQQNGIAERRNRTLIKAARTMLADSKLPTTFWAEAVSTACYVHH